MRISAVCAVLIGIAPMHVSGPISRQKLHPPDRLAVEAISTSISEEAFWIGYSLPKRDPATIVYVRTNHSHEGGARRTQVLAIVPKLNATYLFETCGDGLDLKEGWGPLVGPFGVGSRERGSLPVGT
jgi:hypothetical protein